MGRVKKGGKFDCIKKVVKWASESPQRGILNYNEDQVVVSKIFNSKSYSSIVDAGAGIAINNHAVKFIS